MSDYRRLISYIYAYEGGEKGKNIGFAKIDLRGPQCRIQVNVKKVYVGSSDVGVYLLHAGGELLLGRIFIRSGAGEFRTQVQSENVDGSGISMEDCYGLTIHDVENTWQSYTTIWEDAVAQAAEIQLAEVTAEHLRKQKEEDSVSEPGTQESGIQFPVSMEIERELDAEEAQLEGVAPWEEDGQKEQEKELQKTEPALEPVTPESMEQKTSGPQESVEQKTSGPQESMEQKTSGFQESVEQKLSGPQESVEQKTSGPQESVGQKLPEIRENMKTEHPQGPEDADRLAQLDREENENLADHDIWKKMSSQYTKVLAFDYENGCEILSIKPQDIGLLPREIWVYGNNSFLLHGYYNYRHLILARLQDPQKRPRYLLGVPGHYFSNEKYMASMFGFPHFVLAKKQPQGDGRFGYWYTDIRL